MGQFAVGQSVPREEDPRLLRGEGQYVGDFELPGMVRGYVHRSPHAHARLLAVDVSAARGAPGVLAVFTGEDLAGPDAPGSLRCRFPYKRADGKPMFHTPYLGLARGRVRFVGEPVAYVVAETLSQAKDAAELVQVEYEPLRAVTLLEEAAGENPPAVWEECPDNVAYVIDIGDEAAADAAVAKAAHVIRHRFVISRIAANAIEPRGCIGHYDPRARRYTLYGSIGSGHAVRRTFAEEVFRVPENQFRVVAGDIGGAFGSKGNTAPENILALWASRRIGRPVKWIAERGEALLSDDHARDNVSDAELALDGQGRFLALRVRTSCSLGAYLTSDRQIMSTFSNLGTLAGVYTTPAMHVHVRGVLTNTTTTATYRGAGRPEAAYVIERLIDLAARELKLDPAELRRINTIAPSAMPFKTGLTYTYDCGEFEHNMDAALKLIDYAGFGRRRDESARQGKLRGFGITNTIERAGQPSPETAEIRFDPTGTVTLVVGTKSQGQGHDTMYKILLSDRLGLDSSDVRLAEGDTDVVQFGTGTFGSRSATIGGSAAWLAAGKVIDKGKRIAAHLLEAAESDIAFERGRFVVSGTDRAVTLKDVAKVAFDPMRLPKSIEPGLYETATYSPAVLTFPNGCHACEVEVDRETGRVDVVSYVVVDDVGTVINVLTLKGQVHGGIAQGVGQALMEHMIYDAESGQLATGSFMDYCMPRADDLPPFEVKAHSVPTKMNPLGVKGAGEAGTVGGLPTVMNAVIHALSPLGIEHLEMPLTSQRVWRAIREAGRIS
jgi:carbon-monoxide dehydrogenase large subunit